MGSYDATSPPPATAGPPGKQSEPPPKYNVINSSLVVVVVGLRMFVFTTALVAIIVMVTSKQTKLIPVAPGVAIPLSAELNYVPSFIYLVTALSVACLYSIVSSVLSVLALMKPRGSSTKLQLHFVMIDALLLGILASATGAAIGVAYIGFKGNSHSRWNKVCNTYDSFCLRGAVSFILSLVSSITLLLLVWLSIQMLYKKTTRR
ncbi:unnamed protein product [Lactuca virosa]|uniref:CASP-like protein n=1 Tax=Lactuca virosa TaxID=75947 RepID=A0AAU9MU03_9ASTR|nr:unnamed protein product [Lactuca virosa]